MEPKNMKEPMLMTKETDKEFTHGQEAVIIKEISSRIWDMDSERCTGMKIHITKVNGLKALKVGKDKFGRTVN